MYRESSHRAGLPEPHLSLAEARRGPGAVIPGERIAECSQVLASHFRDLRAYRLEASECVRYKQVVVFGVRRNRGERERLTDADINRGRLQCASLARNFTQLPVLPLEPDARYDVPPSGSVQLICRGLPLDEVEDLLAQSSAYRQAGRILFAEPTSVLGRPLTPLKPGHVGLLAVGGMLNGIFGSGKDLHAAAWQAVKVIDRSEETQEDGTIIQRERERFTNELTLVYALGETAIFDSRPAGGTAVNLTGPLHRLAGDARRPDSPGKSFL